MIYSKHLNNNTIPLLAFLNRLISSRLYNIYIVFTLKRPGDILYSWSVFAVVPEARGKQESTLTAMLLFFTLKNPMTRMLARILRFGFSGWLPSDS